MTNGKSPEVKPIVEDKQRLDILSKEINERLEEFSNIISKTLAIKTDNKVNNLAFEKKSDGGTTVVVTVEPVIIRPPGIYWCDPPGICKASPC
jgi:hypothetical protein